MRGGTAVVRRRSVFAIKDIAEGEALTPGNTAVLRCGKLPPGSEPKTYPSLLGRRASRPIRCESAIQPLDVS